LICDKIDDVKAGFNVPHGQHLLTIVPAMVHQGIGEPFGNGAQRLAEALLVPPLSSVRQVKAAL
jgi:hypothetical protein